MELGSSGAAESDVRRRVLLDDAISRLSNATEISPDNWYVWQRFAEANHARGCVSGGPSRLVYAKRTLRAYCRAADAIERDSNYAWRASEGQTALGTISRLAVCLSETRSGCSVPDPPASADFCHCLEIEPAP